MVMRRVRGFRVAPDIPRAFGGMVPFENAPPGVPAHFVGYVLVDDVDAVNVVEAHLQYFEAIGAVGPQAVEVHARRRSSTALVQAAWMRYVADGGATRPIILSLEMFERDVQGIVDQKGKGVAKPQART